MQDDDKTQILFRAQSNVLEWRFRLERATIKNDQVGQRRAGTYLKFWTEQVCRLAQQTRSHKTNDGAVILPPCDSGG